MIKSDDFVFESTIFSGGEIHIQIGEIKTKTSVNLELIINDSHDLIEYLLVVNALKHLGIEIINVLLKYLPYARQDRVCSAGQAFSLDVINNLLKDKDIYYTIWDVHNESGYLLPINTRIISQHYLFNCIIDDADSIDYFVSPDKGAAQKTSIIANLHNKPVINFDKVRDPKTGNITGMTIADTEIKDNSRIMVVDDICDGGRTFIEVAKILKNKFNHTRLELFTTHGIYSKGKKELSMYYDKITCANNIGATK